MTPEERFTKIENFLSTIAGHEAHLFEHQARMAEHQIHHDKDIQEIREMQKEMQKGTALAIAKVAEAQQITEQKLNALIDTVDRIIGRQGSSPS